MSQVAFTRFVGQIRQGARIRGWGVNPILAMPGFWVHLNPLPLPKCNCENLGLRVACKIMEIMDFL